MQNSSGMFIIYMTATGKLALAEPLRTFLHTSEFSFLCCGGSSRFEKTRMPPPRCLADLSPVCSSMPRRVRIGHVRLLLPIQSGHSLHLHVAHFSGAKLGAGDTVSMSIAMNKRTGNATGSFLTNHLLPRNVFFFIRRRCRTA